MDKSKKNPIAVVCEYEISQEIFDEISQELGENVFNQESVFIKTLYSNTFYLPKLETNFIAFSKKNLKGFSKTTIQKIEKCINSTDLNNLINEFKDQKIINQLNTLKKYFSNQNKYDNFLSNYIYQNYILKNLPKFLYYDEYYTLPSRISINEMQNEELEENDLKTAKALFELADINVKELTSPNDFEDMKSELEATGAIITEEIFNYWKSNTNLEIVFDVDKKEDENNKIIDYILDIRVKNRDMGITLPLKNRSKGFNWFFSFLVWFKRIQEDKSNNYILLLDEPCLNLHAKAQEDLLNFLNDLSKDYQITYTTHSPFMISSEELHKVRTVLERKEGSSISSSIKEKDPTTLFPLQAALGYNLAQNLYISKNNLLVEGVSDLVYITTLSSILESEEREHLNENITIVPVDGLEKVATFISLMRGNELNIACLLDTPRGKGKNKLDNLVKEKIIKKQKIRFFHEFLEDYIEADIEDIFTKEEYLNLYNESFSKNIRTDDLNEDIKPILLQIFDFTKKNRFNHYTPANHLASKGASASFFDDDTLNRFEKIFVEINKLFSD